MPQPPSRAAHELSSTTDQLFAWAKTAHGALALQIWVADDLGFHPRAAAGAPSDESCRALARQCCLASTALVSGNTLALPLTLTDRCSGACLFVMPQLADLKGSALVQARVDAVAFKLDGALQLLRVERLSGVALKSHLLRNSLTIAHAMEQCDRLEPALAQLHHSLKDQLPVDNFFVALLDETRENLVFEYFVDEFESCVPVIAMREGLLSGSLTAFVVSSGRVLRGSTSELLAKAGHPDKAGGSYGPDAHDWLGVPMMVGNEAIGALVVQSYKANIKFSEVDPSTLAMVAEAMAAALLRRREREKLERTVQERTAQVEKAKSKLQDTVNKLELVMDELVQAEKLASLGSMVAGISHELNTPIGNALTVTTALEHRFDVLAMQMTTGSMSRTSMDAFISGGQEMTRLIVRSTQRAVDLLNTFKQVASDQASAQQRVFNLHQVTEDILTTVRTTVLKPDIQIQNLVPTNIDCDSFPGPLGQVIANVVQNSIVHGFKNSDAGVIRVQADQRGNRVRVSITDDGAGMTPTVLARAFDPFFTTQLGRGGSGIGLSVCHRIITSVLGGSMAAASSAGFGATLTLEFPIAAGQRI